MRSLFVLFCMFCLAVPAGLHIAASPASAGLGDVEVYWPLDGNTLDASGNGRDGTLMDGSAVSNQYVTGRDGIGQAIDFNLVAGNTKEVAEATKTEKDYVSLAYTLPESGSISVWKRTSTFVYKFETIWDNSGSPDSLNGADTWESWIHNHGGVFSRACDGDDGRWGDYGYVAQYNLYAPETPDREMGDWIHLTTTWARTDATTVRMSQYVDGELSSDVWPVWPGSTSESMAWMAPGTHFNLASGNDGNTVGIGAYDELGIWSAELTAEEVEHAYYYGVMGDKPIFTPGDANLDDVVDVSDLGVLATNYGAASGMKWGDADFNGDGAVDVSDLGILATNYGTTAAAQAAVPEPTCAVLLAAMIFSLGLYRRR